jgi:hypothetical protein
MFAGMLRTHRDRSLLTQDELAARSGILADALQLSLADREAFQEAAQSERDRRRARAEDLRTSAQHPATSPAGEEQTSGSAAPAQLPADVAGFTGRAEQLAALDRDRVGLAVISGFAGVGKTNPGI